MRILLVVYDNDSFIHWFPLGLAYLASALRVEGHEVRIYQQDQFHYPPEHLTEFLDRYQFDVVGVGVIAGYWQYRKLLSIAQSINASKHRPYFVLGGHGPSPKPEFFLKKTGADAVVIGEGERTFVDLLACLQNQGIISDVNGIAYMRDGHYLQSPRRILIKNIDHILLPAWDLFPMDYYALLRMPHCKPADRVGIMITGRGCPFKCTFCYRMDEGIRLREPQHIISEMRYLKKQYGITYIAFADELTMASPERTRHLCNEIIDAQLGMKWSCNGRLNYATTELLTLMKHAGCVFINYGIEALDDEVLEKMNKHLTVAQIKAGVENTLACGLSPGLNILWGNLGDDIHTLEKAVNFLLKYDDHAQLRTIRPVTPYPGSALYELAKIWGLIKDAEDFYEHKHVNSDLLAANFTTMTDSFFYEKLYEANRCLIENYYEHQAENAVKAAKELYFLKDASFRGFRQS